MQVGNTEIKSSFYVKLYVLGVYFDQKIIFDYHVDELCRKGRRKVSVLARLTKTLDVQSKILLFPTSSQFEYCPLVWQFCSRDTMKKIEKKIQKQDLRYINCL